MYHYRYTCEKKIINNKKIANFFRASYQSKIINIFCTKGKVEPSRLPSHDFKYEEGQYTYVMVVIGNYKYFSGREDIFYHDVKVYECIFHGGVLK